MYSLLKACYIVRNMDDSVTRKKVFTTVLTNSRTIRYIHTLYNHTPNAGKACLLLFYGLKGFASIAWNKAEEKDLLFLGTYPSEKHILGHVRSHMRDVEHSEIAMSLSNCLRFDSVINLLTLLPSIPRLLRIAGQVARHHDFMPACRIYSTITYYMRFKLLLNGTCIKGVFIASQYSPEAVALAAAAHKLDRKVLFTNHANATGETGYVAPIHADLVAVSSQAVADLYRRHSRKPLNVIPIPVYTQQKPLKLPQGKKLTVGIYLTALSNETHLQEIIERLSGLTSIGSVFIRSHPAQIVNLDLSDLVQTYNVTESPHSQSLEEDIDRTDIAICGNSTVAIQILRGGRPVMYNSKLDQLPYDFNSYIKHDLLPVLTSDIDENIFSLIELHYNDVTWVKRMQYFDASYGVDAGIIERKFHNAVKDLIAEDLVLPGANNSLSDILDLDSGR